MKKYLLVLFLALGCLAHTAVVNAQEDETLLSGKVESGGFGGPVVKFSNVKNDFAVFVGGYGGWLINHTFLIGGGGYGMVSSIKAPSSAQTLYGNGKTLNMEFGYGGVVLEYITNPRSLMHFSVSTLIGAGGVIYRERHNFDDNDEDDENSPSDGFFVLEPSASAELNITTFFRIATGVSYRYVSGLNIVGLKNSDLSGPAINVTFKFGSF